MNSERFQAITTRYPRLRVAVVGDFCLDRYLEIDPARQEISIETGCRCTTSCMSAASRARRGRSSTTWSPLGWLKSIRSDFAETMAKDSNWGEVLAAKPGVKLDHFPEDGPRRTFTYCKPLLMNPEKRLSN